MNPTEVLILCDRNLGGFWHLTPEVRDCVGWWPDGSPAWLDHPEHADGRRTVLGTIPKRQSDGDGWLEDDPRVLGLIDTALTLNDVLRPMRCPVLTDAYVAGGDEALAHAAVARIRQSFGPDDIDWVLHLARQIVGDRAVTDGSG